MYRLEVGAACFGTFYLAVMAFFLALEGRGFIEFGTRGLKAEQIIRSDQEATADDQLMFVHSTRKNLDEIKARLPRITGDLNRLERRLQRLERSGHHER